MCEGGETSPEPGYIKAKLTIGYGGTANTVYYGYSARLGAGSLSPALRDVCLQGSAVGIGSRDWSILTSGAFYYNGIKYTDRQSISEQSEIFSWTSMVGKTVTIWLSP